MVVILYPTGTSEEAMMEIPALEEIRRRVRGQQKRSAKKDVGRQTVNSHVEERPDVPVERRRRSGSIGVGLQVIERIY